MTESRKGFRKVRPADERVYFIQAGTDGPIKIGRSTDPQVRLANLQTANHERLVLLGVLDLTVLGNPHAARLLEANLHRMLAADAIAGEWFRPSRHVRQTVYALLFAGHVANTDPSKLGKPSARALELAWTIKTAGTATREQGRELVRAMPLLEYASQLSAADEAGSADFSASSEGGKQEQG